MEAFGLVCLFGITTFDDIRTREIRLLEILAFAILGVAYNIFFHPNSFLSIAGGVMVGMLVLLFSIVSKEKIGRGDAYIIMVAGLFLGFEETLLLLWISSILAALIGIFLLKKYGDAMDKELPFVPFLLLGYLTMFISSSVGGFL